jgi:anti-anti-sigma factor
MTAQRSYRFRIGHVDNIEPMFDDGLTVSVVDDDGTIVFTVSRSIEPVPADAGSGGSLTVVVVNGEIDQDTAPVLQMALAQALSGPAPVCCDLSKVTFFDAAGAHAVLGARRHATGRQRRFFLRGVHGVTERVLSLVDPDRILAR